MKLAGISHLASTGAPTGAEKSLAFLVEALAARGHETAVIAPGPWCLSDRLESAGVEVAAIPSRACWLVQWGPQPVAKQVLRYLRWRMPDPGTRRMVVWLDRYWPDVVYVNCLPQLKGAAAARALGLPVVWHVREILPPGRRRRWFARRLARDASRIVAVSEAVAGWIRDEGLGTTAAKAGSRILGVPTEGLLVGFLGGMEVHKGASDLVAAAEHALRSIADLHIVLATYGPAAEIDAVRRRIAASPHTDHFHLIPPVDDIFRLLAAVDVVAFSSIWPDSLPRVIMEAMAAARPVIATRTGGVPEMVVHGGTGFMVEPGAVEALGDRIVELARSAEIRRRLGSAAADRARSQFSVSAHVDRLERILSEAAHG